MGCFCASVRSPIISCASVTAVCVAALPLLLLRQRHDIFLGSAPSLESNFSQRVEFVTVRQCRVVKPAGFGFRHRILFLIDAVFLHEQGSGAA